MQTIFEPSAREALIGRIGTLDNNNQALWGKMNVHQMLTHCILWEEMILRNRRYKRVFIGLLLGPMLLRNELKDDRPMRKNNPTIPELRIGETIRDIESQKAKWVSLIHEYAQYKLPDFTFVHPFFGKMTREQIGYHAYKHSDHHLRQFGK